MLDARSTLSSQLQLLSAVEPPHRFLLTEDALAFVVQLERRFRHERKRLLARRIEVQKALDAGALPGFLPETRTIREGEWRVAPIPADLLDRRVEITGPADSRKMVINALNSGASCFMADFEDSSSPTWHNVLEGQRNVHDASRRTITWQDPASKKRYSLDERTAVLLVRPRGWHLDERHVSVEGEPVSAALFDFGLHFFWNARELLARGTGPYYYLPKLESHLEARLWNDVFLWAQEALAVPRGTIKATVLIETLPAAFEMDEILWELRDHAAGLNCGRWDYIFSFIKKLRAHAWAVLPDRGQVTMQQHCMQSYSLLLIQTCHRRGALAMGGMAAQIPIKNDAAANAKALAKVRADKRREALAGHDGTWVAHPGLVAIAREELGAVMAGKNQLSRQREDVRITPEDLLQVPRGTITEAGLRTNLSVGIRYLAAWLCGQGCVPLDDLMEDAATAEISRTQVWQWLRHKTRLDNGALINDVLVERLLSEELAALQARHGEERFAACRFGLAARLFSKLVLATELADYLTLPAYEHVLSTRR